MVKKKIILITNPSSKNGFIETILLKKRNGIEGVEACSYKAENLGRLKIDKCRCVLQEIKIRYTRRSAGKKNL